MRSALILGMFLVITLGNAQSSDSRSLFLTVPPQVTIVVREHTTGADMVQVTMLKSGYPEELLQSQLQRLGELLGTPPRGLAMARRDVGTAQRKLDFLTATFAINGLIDRPRSLVRLEQVAKAFAGAPAPFTLTGIALIFDGEPLRETMVGRYTKEGVVRVEAMPSLGPNELPAGVEYRIQLLTQDPSLIVIPETAEKPKPPPPPAPPAPDNRWLVLALGGVAALAAGVLVYLALLRRPSRPR